MNPRWLRRLRCAFTNWWECRTQRCSYYRHYLAWGPPDIPHATYHFIEQQADDHMRTCTYNDHPRYRDGWTPEGKMDLCRVCTSFEKRLRA